MPLVATARSSAAEVMFPVVVTAFRPLQALIAAPSWLFFLFLAAALFRPPGVQFFPFDRILLGVLLFVVTLRATALRQGTRFCGAVGWPMLGLVLLALAGLVVQPYDCQAWSVFAAKWFVPFVLFQTAGWLLDEPAFLPRFETFTLVVLAYLSFIAIASLAGAKSLIFPTYILDESLGIHADRARGPFLQAVANGVTLNLLGLMALNAFRRRRIRGMVAILLLAALPLAILATMTRSVWLAFAGSVVLLRFRSPSRRLRRACTGLLAAGTIALVVCVGAVDSNRSLAERLQDRSPVEFRKAVYQAGWAMFQAKPLLGWGTDATRAELGKRISDFHQDAFYLHNTYLEILVERGLLGLGLYVCLAVGLFRLGRKHRLLQGDQRESFLDEGFRSMWPLFVLVFLVNGSFVVMNYQFVNGLLFAIAGMLAAQNQRLEAENRAS